MHLSRCAVEASKSAPLVFLTAVIAVLAFAVNATVRGLNIVAVGWILMGVGAVGVRRGWFGREFVGR